MEKNAKVAFGPKHCGGAERGLRRREKINISAEPVSESGKRKRRRVSPALYPIVQLLLLESRLKEAKLR
jgi:hypothetical protein